jgi:hypothetical protein
MFLGPEAVAAGLTRMTPWRIGSTLRGVEATAEAVEATGQDDPGSEEVLLGEAAAAKVAEEARQVPPVLVTLLLISVLFIASCA